MRYNRFALTQIGGMQLVYNNRGMIVRTIGQVNFNRGNFGYAYNTYYGSSENYHNGYTYNDNNYYYYKTDGTRAVVEDKKR
jgi:hypothetical protein